MDSFKIGTYQIGYRWVDVFADPKETGGSFFCMPDEKLSHSRIRVGFDYSDIDHPWCNFVHEAMEFILDDLAARLRPTNNFISNASDVYRFHFDHNKFTDACARLGIVTLEIMNDFKAAWDLVSEERKKS